MGGARDMERDRGMWGGGEGVRNVGERERGRDLQDGEREN